jgi:hypothetical protein
MPPQDARFKRSRPKPQPANLKLTGLPNTLSVPCLLTTDALVNINQFYWAGKEKGRSLSALVKLHL